MNKKLQGIFILILLFSSYHLFRDLSSNMGLYHFIFSIGHRPHEWCSTHCSWITIPFELSIIIATVFVLKRNHLGKLGWLLLVVQPLWFVAWLLP